MKGDRMNLSKLYEYIVSTFGNAPYGGVSQKGNPWCKIDTPNDAKANELIAKCNNIQGMNARFLPAVPNGSGGYHAEGVIINVSSNLSKDDFVRNFSQ